MHKVDLTLFATAKHPLRSSALQFMVKCSMQAVLKFLESNDESGQAADTGSAMHHAAHTWHKNGQNYDDAVSEMKLRKGDYPLANTSEAEMMFRQYAKDPRNAKAKIIKVEEEVKLTLSPSKDDKTKKEIVIVGHLDQIREELNGDWTLHDIKTTKKTGYEAVIESLYQMASYCAGATKKFKRPVHPGTIILPRAYIIKTMGKVLSPAGVFWSMPWTIHHVPYILDGLRSLVANIRAGNILINPNVEYCRYCPAKGIDYCIPKLKDIKGKISLL